MKDNSAQVTQLICTIYDAGCIVYCQKRIGGKLSREVKIRRILYLYVIVTWQVNEACILIDMAKPGLPMFNDYGVDSPLPGYSPAWQIKWVFSPSSECSKGNQSDLFF